MTMSRRSRNFVRAATAAACVLAPLSAQNQPSLIIRSSAGYTGSFCATQSCTPSPLAAVSGDLLDVQVLRGGTPLLVWSLAPAGCLQVPGFDGQVIVQPTAMALPLPLAYFGRIYVDGGPGGTGNCGGLLAGAALQLPPLPTGMQFVVQALAPGFGSGLQPGLSNAILLTIQ